jgi:pimeloyl-ACP methyl ester carboxylesterase
MLEPYQPGKIPVLMVHGIWSSPITWMEMFNDLRSAPEVRDRYQFWFYLYPTGQPFWYSAKQLRDDLAEMRRELDPRHSEPALDQMILVGHSMGGLVSKLQVLDSRNDFWNIVSEQPFTTVKASDDVRLGLETTFFFHPNPSVRRVITIGTPHRGSNFANGTTRFIGSRLITLPKMLVNGRTQLIKDNPGLFRSDNVIEIPTSIDSLSPKCPVLPVMLSAATPPWIKFHNIVGLIPDKGFIGRVAGGSDGIVPFNSAHLDNVSSEIVVNADHVQIHSHPRSVLEVRRILLEHLAELNVPPSSPLDRQPWTAPTWTAGMEYPKAR